MTVSSSTGRSFRRTSYPTQHSHLFRHEALRRDHGFTSVCRIHNVLSWFTAAQTGLTFLTVADASVFEGLDEYIVTVDVGPNSTRPEPSLARNLWALPKRGGTILFATVTVCTVFDRKLFTFWCDRVCGASRARPVLPTCLTTTRFLGCATSQRVSSVTFLE